VILVEPFDNSAHCSYFLVMVEFSYETVEAFIVVLGSQTRIENPLIKGLQLLHRFWHWRQSVEVWDLAVSKGHSRVGRTSVSL
jgi:hypothetical protein